MCLSSCRERGKESTKGQHTYRVMTRKWSNHNGKNDETTTLLRKRVIVSLGSLRQMHFLVESRKLRRLKRTTRKTTLPQGASNYFDAKNEVRRGNEVIVGSENPSADCEHR